MFPLGFGDYHGYQEKLPLGVLPGLVYRAIQFFHALVIIYLTYLGVTFVQGTGFLNPSFFAALFLTFLRFISVD